MANEWAKVELYGANNDGCPRRFTIADGVSVSKGQTLVLSDPRTAAGGGAGLFDPCAGVAAMEKEANDGSTSISVWTDGVFEAVASGAIAVGQAIMFADLNRVKAVNLSASGAQMGAQVCGYALEAADNAETINVRLRL